jgi:uncharacterized protein YndB with AHSA1/START domain
MAATTGKYPLEITTPGTEIVMTRLFDAPRDLVFEAHTSCEHVSRWWGPRGFETLSCEIDFHPGGRWRIVHAKPDGEQFAFSGEYREIVRPERFVWTFSYESHDFEPGVPASRSSPSRSTTVRPRSRRDPSSTLPSSATRSCSPGWSTARSRPTTASRTS